jgi:hypothetical protein
MDLIKKFLTENSYKFPKGYPDLTQKGDTQILENLVQEVLNYNITLEESKKPFEFLSPEAQEIGREIIDILNVDEENLKALSKTKIVILTDLNREEVFSKLKKAGFQKNVNISGSSQGGMEKDNVQVIVKPLSKQGGLSAGKQNESKFNELINSHIEENGGSPINVIFKGSDKTLVYKNVAKVVDASTSGATEFDKSDSDLLDSSNNIIVGVSLKKRNAIRWESSKSRPIDGVNVFKSFIDKVGKIGSDDEVGEFENVVLSPLEQRNKYKLTNPQTNQVVSRVIIKGTPPSIIKNVVFGDTKKKTIVIKETFEGDFNNFSYDENKETLTIKCYKIYTDVDDLIGSEDEPVFAFSNHIGQAYGIEFRSFSKGSLYRDEELRGSNIEIDFKELL